MHGKVPRKKPRYENNCHEYICRRERAKPRHCDGKVKDDEMPGKKRLYYGSFFVSYHESRDIEPEHKTRYGKTTQFTNEW